MVASFVLLGIGFFMLVIGAGASDTLSEPNPDSVVFWLGLLMLLAGLTLYGVTWRSLKKRARKK
jgi:hypothetical protein